MNIVFDENLKIDDNYRKALVPLLPLENAPLKLNSSTSKTDGTLRSDEGIVFMTDLPIDVLKYHSEFFEHNNDVPQWFFVLLNRDSHGIIELRNAARKYGLKNCTMFHAWNIETFETAIKEILNTIIPTKGKTLLLSKHQRSWTANLASLLFGNNEEKYQIMDSVNMSDTDSEILLLCGEKINDFKGFALPDKMEPYFVFNIKEELQHYIYSGELIAELAEYHHMTTERVESRLCFVDIESEAWLDKSDKTVGEDAVLDGILLWDRFGLPVSRSEYTKSNIAAASQKRHKGIEKIKEILPKG